jgi:hypothetical protein
MCWGWHVMDVESRSSSSSSSSGEGDRGGRGGTRGEGDAGRETQEEEVGLEDEQGRKEQGLW